jgi:hypothetical protein
MRTTIGLLLLAIALPAAGQELGRLFFTPDQRDQLDARRKARVPDKPAAPVVASPTTRLDGYVKRSGGPSTVFINGEPTPEASSDAGRIGAAPDGRTPIAVGEGGGRRALKPGEVLDRGTGEVRDVIGEGRITVERKK